MACVLTAAMIEDDRAVIGHVGDTRLYKLRGGHRENHPGPFPGRRARRRRRDFRNRRDAPPAPNEVYRDVGSEPHEIGDPDFVEIRAIDVGAGCGAAPLQRWTDGPGRLGRNSRIVQQPRASPTTSRSALVKAANDAGGKDNITVVFVEGERFAGRDSRGSSLRRSGAAPCAIRSPWLSRCCGIGRRLAFVRLPDSGRRREFS